MSKLTIFRLTWSHARGVYWLAMRQCEERDAERWLSVFRADEPGARYEAFTKPPRVQSTDRSAARHIATL